MQNHSQHAGRMQLGIWVAKPGLSYGQILITFNSICASKEENHQLFFYAAWANDGKITSLQSLVPPPFSSDFFDQQDRTGRRN